MLHKKKDLIAKNLVLNVKKQTKVISLNKFWKRKYYNNNFQNNRN